MTADPPAEAPRAQPDVPRGRRLVRVLANLVGLATVLLVWEGAVRAFDVPRYLVPAPSTIVGRLVDGFVAGSLLKHTLATLGEILVGYVFGCGLGIGLGILIAQFRLVDELVYPYVVALNSVPKVATAPLIVVWFGFGFESKVIIVALVAFFPLLVNVILGLRSVEADQLALMRALTASRWQSFSMVQLPNALPSIFAGLEVAVVLAVVGAVVGEFVSAKEGLGYYILFANSLSDTAGMFAAFMVLAALGAALSQVVTTVARRVVFWRAQEIVVESA